VEDSESGKGKKQKERGSERGESTERKGRRKDGKQAV